MGGFLRLAAAKIRRGLLLWLHHVMARQGQGRRV
ncbi:hypothetical protein LCGC14_2551250, partial [marine sediment metagenome]